MGRWVGRSREGEGGIGLSRAAPRASMDDGGPPSAFASPKTTNPFWSRPKGVAEGKRERRIR